MATIYGKQQGYAVDESLKITVLISETVAAGISAQALASYLQVPGIVFLLLFGVLLGPDGLGVLEPALLFICRWWHDLVPRL